MEHYFIEKAEKLLGKCTACTVASISETGYPRICVLVPLKTKGIKEFWFSTGTSSNKVRHFLKNSKAGVTFYEGGDSVTLTGEMSILSDKTVKDDLWRDWLGKHFANGGKNDPEYCIIHFIAKEATVYIDNEFETLIV